MRSRLPSWIYTGLVLAALAGTQTGCKSGWKMPGSDMFSWTRKPSESTLSGSGPSISMPSSSTAMSGSKSPNSPGSIAPMSPALRSTPSPVNSTAANPPGSAARPYGQPAAGTYGQPGTGPYGPTVAGNAMTNQQLPTPGAAATANGYSTGNYATNQARSAPTGTASPYGPPPSAGYPQSPPQGLVASNNPYPTTPYPSAPNPPTGAAPQGSMASTSVPALPSSVPSGPYGALLQAGPNIAQNNAPTRAGYVPSSNSTVPATTASYGVPNLPPSLPPQSSMPNAYGGASPSNTTAAAPQNYNGPTPYRPGSVGRSTSYDFSNQGSGAVPTSGGSAYPRTANEVPTSVNR